MSGDAARVLVRSLERAVAVGRIRQHDRRNLFQRHLQVRAADALPGAGQWNRSAIGRRLQAVVDVVHAFQCRWLPRVHFDDHALGLLDPRLVVADRRARNQAAVFQHRRHLNQRQIEFAQESVFHELRDMAQVDVHVLHLAGIDALARFRIGLIGQPQVNAASHRQRAVEFWPGRSAGEDADLKLLAAQIRVRDAARQRHRHSLRVAGAGKAAHADLVTVVDQSGRIFGAHDSVCQAGVQYTGSWLGPPWLT